MAAMELLTQVLWSLFFKPGARRPTRAWFLRIASVRESMRVCVCPPPRLLITSGVMWCDIDPI